VVDGTNVVAVQAHNFHVLLNVQTFEHDGKRSAWEEGS
jgi:hypothetical protein